MRLGEEKGTRPHILVPNAQMTVSCAAETYLSMKVEYVIDERKVAPECEGPFKVCKFTATRPDFDIHIKLDRKIWLSHYALRSCNEDEYPDYTPEHELRFWKMFVVDARG